MKKEIKRFAGLGIVLFILFLFVHYWENISVAGTVLAGAITPLLGGIVIAYIVNIPMSFYESTLFGGCKNKVLKVLKRPVCMLLSFATVAALVVAVVVLILPELTQCINIILTEVPPFFQNLYNELESKYEISEFINQNVLNQFSNVNDVTDVIGKIIAWFFSGFGNVIGSLFVVVSAVFSVVFAVFMSFVFAVYLLFGKEKIFIGMSRFVNAYSKERTSARLHKFVRVADESFHRFIVGQCTEAIILGVLCIIGMNIFSFPYATMIGTLVGFTALIPIAGAYIGALVGAVMIMTTGTWIQGLLFVVFIIVLQQLEGNLIYPRVVGASIGLPGIWVLATITIAGSLGGIPAMLVGVPLVATFYRLVKSDVRKRLDADSEAGTDEIAGDGGDTAEASADSAECDEENTAEVSDDTASQNQ